MGLFSFLSKNKQDPDDDFDVPVKPRRSRGAKASDAQDPVDPVLPEKKRIERFNAPGPGGYAEHLIIPADESCESIVFSDLRIRLADWLV